eukprot:gene16351-biopygen12046
MENKISTIDRHIDNLTTENKEMRKENEALQKQAKESQRKVEVAQQKIDDLEQYGCKTMIEINGFPRSNQENPVSLTLKLAEKIDVPVCEEEIEACHCISANEKAGIIVEFSSRKKRDQFLEAKKKLREITVKDFDLQPFINTQGY